MKLTRIVAPVFGAMVALKASVAPPKWYGKNWAALPVQEKAVQYAAYYADKEKVREVGGNNRGYWVARFLEYVWLKEGYAWCAAFISYLLYCAGWTYYRSASVLNWRSKSVKEGWSISKPVRGCLCLWVKGSGKTQSRHIEICISVAGEPCPTWLHKSGRVPAGYIQTIGGNTSSGIHGSQEDGDGVFRRIRPLSAFTHYVKWW